MGRAYHGKKGRSTRRAVVTALAATALLAGGATARAWTGDLVGDVEAATERADRPLRPQSAPGFRATDMYGKEIALSDYQGANVVLTFLSPACIDEAVEWLKGVQNNYLGQRDVVFVNVLHPGPTPAFSSRSASLKKIRDRVEDFYAQARDKMPDDERKRLEGTEIRWIIDWKRDLHERYDAIADRVTILVLDKDGRIREQLGRRSPESERRLVEVLDGLRANARE